MAHDKGGARPYPRSARVNQILREVISDTVVRLSDIDDQLTLLTVTGVETSPDLRQATVFFDSLTPEVKEALEARRTQIQAMVNAQTDLKRTPKLAFRVDPAVSSGEAVEEIIRRLRDEHDA